VPRASINATERVAADATWDEEASYNKKKPGENTVIFLEIEKLQANINAKTMKIYNSRDLAPLSLSVF
jgi:hypothetical protein